MDMSKKPRPAKVSWDSAVSDYVGPDDSYGHPPRKLFDVTCVIGSVYDGGTEDPTIVAFRMIAEHKADGTFTFPNIDLDTISVTVQTTKREKQ